MRFVNIFGDKRETFQKIQGNIKRRPSWYKYIPVPIKHDIAHIMFV